MPPVRPARYARAVRYVDVAQTSAAVAAARGRKAKVAALAALLGAAAPDERAIVARHLAGDCGHKLGVGYALVSELAAVAPADAATLTVGEVDARLAALAAVAGAGAKQARRDAVAALFAAATAPEAAFLRALLVGEVRQGALAALVVEATALAGAVPLATVRTAYMLAGELGAVVAAALAGGAAALAGFTLTLFRPVLPMLAQTADDPAAALAALGGRAAFDHKLDGFRVQVHKDGALVRAYSRLGNDVTASVPEVIAAIAALPAQRLIVDGEALGHDDDGRPLPFQDTMRRKAVDGGPLAVALFDLLRIDDEVLLDAPAIERWARLDAIAGPLVVPRLVTDDGAAAAGFYAAALAAGHEGVVAKALDAPYAAGTRGAAWLKIKKVRRLDLVVLAAEWGSGRRAGWLSNLHLGARDGDGWAMLGKTFKGLTDETLRWQTEALSAREVSRAGHVVHVRPELVVEVEFNDVQRSSRYPSGLALRHARVVRYRDDKRAAEADPIAAVWAIARADGVVALAED